MSSAKGRRFLRTLVVLGILAGAGWWFLQPQPVAPEPEDLARLVEVFGGEADFGPPQHDGFDLSSVYVTMEDGVDIAVDVLLPQGLEEGEEVPVVVVPTRYWRRWELYFPFSRLKSRDMFDRMFTAYGFGLVYIDVRGTGASFGSRDHPWSSREISDLYQIMDWIEDQPWSSGSLGVCGTSYGGTCAEFMAAMAHPALKAAIIRYSLFDVYQDIAFPGGVFNQWFVSKWSQFNSQLDANATPAELPWFVSFMVRGVAPVDTGEGDPRQTLVRALMDHSRNGDIFKAAAGVTFRNDKADGPGVSVDSFSPHRFWQESGASDIPLYVWGGWFDGAYAGALLTRLEQVDNPQRVVIGPWNHAGVEHASPYLEPDTETDPSLKVQYLEQLRYFEHYLKGKGNPPANECIYYTLGEETWNRAPAWPPAPVREAMFHLAPGHELGASPPEEAQESVAISSGEEPTGHESLFDEYEAVWDVGTGERNRWRTQLGRSDVVYDDREEQDSRLLVYDSAPLEEGMLVLGRPRLDVWMASSSVDTAVFAYLEDVGPDGAVRYLSEGMIRLLHGPGPEGVATFAREDARDMAAGEPVRLRLELLPVAVRIAEGHRIRLALACADQDQFVRLPATGDQRLTLFRSTDMPSRLILPVAMEEPDSDPVDTEAQENGS